jgi:hypothetical protein
MAARAIYCIVLCPPPRLSSCYVTIAARSALQLTSFAQLFNMSLTPLPKNLTAQFADKSIDLIKPR